MSTADSITPPPIAVQTLAVREVSFGYGETPAVEGVSWSAGPGERVAIVGPNGCGKSTLLKLMVGALVPRKGEVLVDGKALAGMGRLEAARRLALVPQLAGAGQGSSDGLGGGGFTVREMVLMARYAANSARAAALGRLVEMAFETDADVDAANRAMWTMDVHHLAPRAMEALSGGERQRVLIARALAQETPVLLLDEPTSALDLYHQLELLAHLEALSAKGRMVVMVTHDLALAARFATRVVLMDRGRLVADGKPGEVLTPAVLEPVYRVKCSPAPADALHFTRMG